MDDKKIRRLTMGDEKHKLAEIISRAAIMRRHTENLSNHPVWLTLNREDLQNAFTQEPEQGSGNS